MKSIKYYEKLEVFIDTNKNSKSKFFLLVAENFNFNFDLLNYSGLDFKGAIVPQIVYEDFNTDRGMVACELDDSIGAFILEDMTTIDIDKEQLQEFDSIMLIVDGLSKHITTFLEAVFQTLPMKSEIIGGGAGKLTFKQEPVIFSKNGMFQDAAIILAGKSTLSVGVENGWEYLEGPFIVTSAEKNILKSLNFKNAFDVYKEFVEENSGLKFDEMDFFDIAKAYPLGIVKFNNEIVVRDPIGLDENGNMILVGDIEQNSTVNILKGEKEKLIKSSSVAINNAIKKVDDLNIIKHIVLFDCISRTIFLEKYFKKELASIKEPVPNRRVFGALTLGEIANNGNEYINFYNKTCVVGALC